MNDDTQTQPSRAPTSKGTLEFIDIVKDYGTGEPAVKGVSFRVNDGDLVTMLGPSGCGKTTILRMIAGLELPTRGQILLGGRDVTAQSAAQRNVSLVFQSYALFPHMNVMANVCYGLTVQRMNKTEAAARAKETIDLLGLNGFEERLPSELSGGQQQRVAIARALVLEPAVLLFDEPLSNLDTKLRRHVREEIRELQQRLKLTCVYVTHDREEAMAVSDQIIVMDKGVIAEMGAPSTLFFSPRSAFVADFLSEANVLRAELSSTNEGMANVRLGAINFTMPMDGAVTQGEVKLALRPDAFRIDEVRATDAVLPGIVRKSSFIGKGVEVVVDTSAGEVFVFLPHHRTALPSGASVQLAFDPGEAHLTV